MMEIREWPEGKNVKKATWDRATNVLTVYFRMGTYQYNGVDEGTWEMVKSHTSGGQAVHQYIIGVFDAEKIE